MKHIKISWYLLMVVFLVAGLYTGRREYFLLFFIMGFVLVCAFALNLWTFYSFSFIQELSQPSVVKGSVVNIKIGIYNDKPFPFTMMKILTETVLPADIYELSFNLSPMSNINFTIPVTCPYRGIYHVGMTKIEINDIFGLVKTRFDMRRLSYYRQQPLKILPNVIELPYLPTRNADAKFSGAAAMRLADDGDSFSDLRRYRPGDPFKRVHKPVSARKRELYVKSYDIPLETAVFIAIDPFMDIGEGEYGRYMADKACECMTAITDISLRSGFTVEFAGVDLSRSMKRRSKREILSALCDTLAELPFNKKGDFGRLLESVLIGAGGCRAAYVISAADPAEHAGALLRLRREGCHVCCIKISGAVHYTEGDQHPDNVLSNESNEVHISGISCITVKPGDDIRTVLTGDHQ